MHQPKISSYFCKLNVNTDHSDLKFNLSTQTVTRINWYTDVA